MPARGRIAIVPVAKAGRRKRSRWLGFPPDSPAGERRLSSRLAVFHSRIVLQFRRSVRVCSPRCFHRAGRSKPSISTASPRQDQLDAVLGSFGYSSARAESVHQAPHIHALGEPHTAGSTGLSSTTGPPGVRRSVRDTSSCLSCRRCFPGTSSSQPGAFTATGRPGAPAGRREPSGGRSCSAGRHSGNGRLQLRRDCQIGLAAQAETALSGCRGSARSLKYRRSKRCKLPWRSTHSPQPAIHLHGRSRVRLLFAGKGCGQMLQQFIRYACPAASRARLAGQ